MQRSLHWLQWDTQNSPPNLPLLLQWSPPHLIHPFLDRPHSPYPTVSGSNQPFCHSTLSVPTDRPTDQHTHIHTDTHNRFTALWICPGQPVRAYPGNESSLICFLHLLRLIASSLFNPRAWQSFPTVSLQVGLAPSTSYCIHFFTRSLSSFRNTCPYHRYLFCCIKIRSWTTKL